MSNKSKSDGGKSELGYIPGSFLKKYEGATDFNSSVELKDTCLGFVSSVAIDEIELSLKYIATEDYITDDPRQVSFTAGTLFIVVEKSEDGG